MSKRRVVIAGLGVVSPYGLGSELYWQQISAGRSAARMITNFDVNQLPTQFAGQLPIDDNELGAFVCDQKMVKTLSRAGKFAVIAAQEAIADADLKKNGADPDRIGTSIGAGGHGLWDIDHTEKLRDVFVMSLDCSGGVQFAQDRIWANIRSQIHPLTPLKTLSNVPTAQIAIMANARGPSLTITTACTSSAQALGEGLRQIQHGAADVMLAGGSDSMVNPYGMVAFSMLGVLSANNREYESASRPFDRRRDGFMIGEGAAVCVLEEYEHCRRRGGKMYAELIGYKTTNDAYRLTDEPPDAWGSVAAMRGSLADAGIPGEQIDYVNAHGTGTRMNDRTETGAIKSVFGEHANRLAVSSTKSMIGHLVAAAGAIEFAACVKTIEHQVIPPTINLLESDPDCDLDYVPGTARPARIRTILTNSFGFGGQNACLILQRIGDT